MRLALAAALALTVALPAGAQDGRALFKAQCSACHTINGVSDVAGPSLKGVAGRKIASAPGYTYSSGLKAKTGTWTDANLDAYLTAPVIFAPGNRMFARVAQPEARKAIIGYLKTLH